MDNPISLNALDIAFPYRGRFLSGSLDSSRCFAVSLRGKYTREVRFLKVPEGQPQTPSRMQI